MATRTVANGGGNYNAIGTWVEGAVPTNADDVVFTATSGALTISGTSDCKTFNTANNTATITINSSLRVSGNITLTAGFTITSTSGSPQLIAIATGTLTSNGVTFPYILSFQGVASQTFTLADNWTVGSLVFAQGASSVIAGSKTIFINENLTHSSAQTMTSTGTTLVMQGTGSINNTAGGSFSCDITINTSGTITFGTTVRFTTGIFSWIAGTVNSTGSNFTANSPCTIDVNGNTDGGGNAICSTGINFFNFTHSGSVSTITLTTPICIINLLILASGAFNNAGIYCQGSLATSTNTGGGTSTLFLIGSGTINCSAMLRNTTVINTNGIYKFPINFTNNTKIFSFNSVTLTYLKGNLDTRNVTFLCQATSTLIGVHKLRFRRVFLSNQITMDEFFQGSASQICQVVSGIAGVAYAVVFTNGFQKISNYTSVQDMTLTNTNASRGSLLLTYSKANRGRNVGNITYINDKPNGIIHYHETVKSLETMAGVQLQGDPAYN